MPVKTLKEAGVWTVGLDGTADTRYDAVDYSLPTAIVVGLVVITPAAGFVSPQSALAMGALGAIPSYYAIVWRSRTRLDDSLDVLAGHGVGGILGALLTGVFNTQALGGPGLVGDWVTASIVSNGIGAQVWIQLKGVLLTIVWSGVVAFIAFKIADQAGNYLSKRFDDSKFEFTKTLSGVKQQRPRWRRGARRGRQGDGAGGGAGSAELEWATPDEGDPEAALAAAFFIAPVIRN